MKGQTHYGKGSARRKENAKTLLENWDRIFGSKDKPRIPRDEIQLDLPLKEKTNE